MCRCGGVEGVNGMLHGGGRIDKIDKYMYLGNS